MRTVMKRWPNCFVLVAVLFWLPVQFAATSISAEPTFTVSIDKGSWQKWGFEYPATYVFRVSDVATQTQVKRRDAGGFSWTLLEPRTPQDFFNGVECGDLIARRASLRIRRISFQPSNGTCPGGTGSAEFESIARYYDGRKAVYTLSNDNWGCNAWAHPGTVERDHQRRIGQLSGSVARVSQLPPAGNNGH